MWMEESTDSFFSTAVDPQSILSLSGPKKCGPLVFSLFFTLQRPQTEYNCIHKCKERSVRCMLEISPKTNLLEQKNYRYALQDVAEPNL